MCLVKQCYWQSPLSTLWQSQGSLRLPCNVTVSHNPAITIKNSNGNSKQPWCTPVMISNPMLFSPPILTVRRLSLYRFLAVFIILSRENHPVNCIVWFLSWSCWLTTQRRNGLPLLSSTRSLTDRQIMSCTFHKNQSLKWCLSYWEKVKPNKTWSD